MPITSLSRSGPKPGALGVQALCVAALIGVCAIAWVLGSLSGRQSAERAAPVHRSDAASARGEALRDCPGLTSLDTFDCLYARAESGGAAARADQSLAAQQRLSFAALAAAIAALLTAALAAIGLVYLRETLGAWRASVADAHRIGEAQVRCYLGVARVVIDLTDHSAPVVSCRIVNSGQSPALDTRWRAALVLDGGDRSAFHAPVDAHGLTIPAHDGSIPADIAVAHDLSDAVQRIATGADALLLCTIELTGEDVFGQPIRQSESFAARLDSRIFTNPLVTLQPYGGA